MKLLEAIFNVPNIQGDIAVWKQGSGTRFITLADLPNYERQEDWYFHIPTHNRNLIDAGKRGSKKSAKNFTALWCDFDMAWKDSKYPTDDEFRLFIEALDAKGISPSAIIRSGGGYHLYWFLDKPYDCQQTPSACKSWNAFLNLTLNTCIDREVKIDQLGDMARVLRIPGTINKGKLVQEIAVNETKRFALQTLLQFTEYHQVTERGSGKAASNNRLLKAMGVTGVQVKSYTRNLITQCGQVREFFRSGGDVSEPLWYSFAGLLPYTDDGLDYFINLSENVAHAKDSDRSASGAVAKIEQWKSASDGPALCARFNDHNPSVCQACPHFNNPRIKTPLQVAHDEIKVEIPPEPEVEHLRQTFKNFEILDSEFAHEFAPKHPFLFNEHGQLCKIDKTPAGVTETTIVLRNKLVPNSHTFSEAIEQYMTHFDVYTQHDGVNSCPIPTGELMAGGNMNAIKELVGKGLLISHGQQQNLSAYLTQCNEYMHNLSKSHRSYSRMGWRSPDIEDNNPEEDDRFVLGNVVFYRNGAARVEKIDTSLESIAQTFTFKGDVDKWRAAAAHFAKPGLEMQLLAFMGGFAVPLMRAGQTKGLTVNLLSRESGTLKSFTLRAITSIYGIPDEGKLKADDSYNAQMAKIARHCDLPVTYDEITHITGEELSPLLYQMTSGKRGDKMTQSNEIRENSLVWRTVLFSSSNSSLDDKLQIYSKPERMRLLEIPFSRELSEKAATPQENAMVMETMNQNYGVAGVIWLQYLASNRDAIFDEVKSMREGMLSMVGNDNSKRFWISFLASVVVAAKHTRQLGLHSFNIETIMSSARELIDAADDKLSKEDYPMSHYVHEFINDNLDKTQVLKFEGIKTFTNLPMNKAKRLREARGEVNVLIQMATAIGSGVMRRAYISRQALKDYLIEQRITFKDMMDHLKREGVLLHETRRPRVHLDDQGNSVQLNAIEIDLIALEKLSVDVGVDATGTTRLMNDLDSIPNLVETT